MAKSSKRELDEIKSLLLEIDKIYQKIGISNPFSKDTAAQFVGQVNKLKDALEDANDVLHDMDDGIGDITKSWKAIIDEAKAYKNSVYSSKNALTSLSSISEKLMNHQKGISNLSSKQLKSLQEQAKANRESLNTNQDLLQSQINVLKKKEERARLDKEEQKKLASLKILYENVNNLLEDKDSILFKTNQMLEDELDLTSQIEKKTGILGGLLKGISKIPIFGNIFDANEALKASEDAIRDTTKSTSGLKAAFKNISGQIKDGFLNPANLVLLAVTSLGKALKDVDSGTGDLAKSMNKTYSEAINIRTELTDIANTSGDVALTTKGLQETYIAVGKALGTNSMLNEKDLKTMTKLTQQAGMTYDELMEIEKISLVNGKSLDENTSKILGSVVAYNRKNKAALNEKDILRDVNKMSASLKLTLGGNVEKMAEAASKAKQFGLNLEQAEKISQNLLNFESSIESELSAELLLGKNLNFERARGLALNGQTADAAAEIAKQVGTSADFAKMNVIQQEAIAKAAGMERNELAQSLIDREALNKMGVKGAKTAQEAYNELRKQGLSEAEINKRIGDEKLSGMYEQQSVQERFNQSVLKLQEIFVNLAGPILQMISPIVDILIPALESISFILTPIFDIFNGIGKILTGSWDSLNGWEETMGGIAILATSILAITKMEAMYHGFIKGYKIAQLALENANKTGILGTIGALTTQLGVQLGLLSASLATNAALTFGVGVAVAVAAAAAGYAAIKALTADDMFSPGGGGGGYGKRTLFGPEGAIKLNDKDTVIAGTNLFDGESSKETTKISPKETTTKPQTTQINNVSSANMEQTNALLQQLINVISSGGDVVLDGQKVGAALKLGSFKTQ
jgi:hypothetical protein